MSGYSDYAHAAVGSDTLADYYDQLSHQYALWGSIAQETNQTQPIAVVFTAEDVLDVGLGIITRTRSARLYPKGIQAGFRDESPENGLKLRFEMWLDLGELAVNYVDDGSGQPEIIVCTEKIKIQGAPLDETVWEADVTNEPDVCIVDRQPRHTVVAFGEDAIQSLPSVRKFCGGI